MPIELITGIEPANDGTFKMVKGKDVDLTETTELTTGNLADADSILVDDGHAGTQASTKHTLLSSLWAYIQAKITGTANIIDSDQYVDGSIDTAHIGDDQVTEAKLANSLLAEIEANTAKTGITGGQASAITANTAKTGITGGQASAITANTAKISYSTAASDAVALNTDKATNVATNLTASTHASQITINSSDGDNVVIAEADGSIAGVMTVAHHDKLDGIEDSATADQTKSDINGLAITTVGTIDTGTWQGTTIKTAYIGDDQVTEDKLANTLLAEIDGALQKSGGTMSGDIDMGSGNISNSGTITGTFVGDVTGNASGTAATVTGAAQTAITSTGTLTALQVDNINIDGNAITSSTAADLVINVTDGQSVVVEGLNIDDGVVTNASSITSTNFVGELAGNASTATKIATITNDNIVQLAESQTLTNKTLVAPALGTPASGALNNCTFPTLNQDTTGTAEQANLASLSDESTDQTCFITFASDATGFERLKTGSNLTFDSSTGTLTANYIIGKTNTFTFTQSSVSDTWIITHNLDKFPNVTVVDSGGSVVRGTIVYNSLNKLTITFFAGGIGLAFSGKAYLN